MKSSKFLSLLLALAMALSIVPLTANAAVIASGSCGAECDNITWSLDDQGTFTLSGSGAMEDYTWDGYVPWYSQRSSVKRIDVSAGITSIGDYAFYYCTALPQVTLPDSVTSIGHDAFYYCTGLTQITLPGGLTSIGYCAFQQTNLTQITLPASLSSMGNNVFSYCANLRLIIFLGKNAPAVAAYTFANLPTTGEIVYPDTNKISELSQFANWTKTPIPDLTTVTANAGNGGSITPSGGAGTYTVTPDSGFVISQVFVDGAEMTVNDRSAFTHTFASDDKAHSMFATFASAADTLVSLATVSYDGAAGTVTVLITSEGISGTPIGNIFFAAYEGNKVVFVSGNKTAKVGTSTYTWTGVPELSAGTKLKAYVWEGLDTLKPLCESIYAE